MSREDCRFCQIVRHKLPASFVFDSPKVSAFMDAFPISPGHVLVVPVIHYEDVFEIPDEVLADAFKLAKRVSIAARTALGNITGVNLLQNNGRSAGQRVPHFHIHVIPRMEEVAAIGKWAPTRRPAERAVLEELAQRIRTKLPASVQ